MIRGRVVMMLLIVDDGVYSCDCVRIASTEVRNLVSEMPKDDALYGYRCGSYCTAAKKTGDKTQDSASKGTKKVASASWVMAPFQFGLEDCTMSLLVALKFLKLRDEVRCRETSHENLTRVYIYGAVLAGVIDLDDATTQVLSRNLETHLTPAA